MLKTVVIIAACISATIFSAEPDAAVAAQYRNTFLRRYSSGAKTRELPVSADAARLADLFLDFQRNRLAAQNPNSPAHHRGVAHLENGVAGNVFTLTVAYAVIKLDSVALPLADAPALLTAALKPEFAVKAKVAAENERDFERWRMLLVGTLLKVAPPTAPAVKSEAAALLLKAFSGAAADDLSALGEALGALNDEGVASALIAQAKAANDPARRAVLLRTVAGCNTRAAEQFVLQTLASGTTEDKAALLSGIGAAAGETVFANLGSAIADAQPQSVMFAALASLERHNSPRARALLEKSFGALQDEQLKYNAACALTRMGSPAAIEFLKARQAAWQNDPQRSGMAGYVKQLLADAQKKSAPK